MIVTVERSGKSVPQADRCPTQVFKVDVIFQRQCPAFKRFILTELTIDQQRKADQFIGILEGVTFLRFMAFVPTNVRLDQRISVFHGTADYVKTVFSVHYPCRRGKHDLIPLRSGECDRHIRHATNIAACSIVVLVSSDIGQHLFVAATKCDHYIFGLIIRLSQLQLTRCRHCQGRGRVSQLRHLFCLSRIIHPNVRRSPQFIRHTAQLELLRCTCAGVASCAEGGSIC